MSNLGSCANIHCDNPARYKYSGLCCTCTHRVKKGIPLDRPKLGHRDFPVSFAGAHRRLHKEWGSASQYPCVKDCGRMALHWAYDGTDPTYLLGRTVDGKRMYCRYSRFPEFYMPMCARCHRAFDGETFAAELGALREWMYRTGKTLDDLRTMA